MDVKIRPAQLFIFNNVPSTKSDVWGFFCLVVSWTLDSHSVVGLINYLSVSS